MTCGVISRSPFTRKLSHHIILLMACGSVTVLLCVLTLALHPPSSLLRPYRWGAMLRETLHPPWSTFGKNHTSSETLGVASNIYVVSLARRTDRRQDMDFLAATMGLRWMYVNSVEAQDEKVLRILDHVRDARQLEASQIVTEVNFRWPNDIDTLSSSTEPLIPGGSDLWSLPPSTVISSSSLGLPVSRSGLELHLTCSENDATVRPYDPGLPPHYVLTASKIACWYSHVNVMRLVANRPSFESEDTFAGTAVVLEDDVDMERDIRDRLQEVWKLLPLDWDIVFLGHCWSNESYHPALTFHASEILTSAKATDAAIAVNNMSSPTHSQTSLHPSYGPKCTHAYVLSQRGARRILLHLRHPRFAYSRAIDQALMWLVKSGRIRSYSVVPSVVVQRKVGGSDILQGAGSDWKEALMRGVF